MATYKIPSLTVDAQIAHQKGFSGKGVGVAVLDSGIYNHADYSSPYYKIKKFVDFINYRTIPYDDNSHGCHVCGIVCSGGKDRYGSCIGVAPGCHMIVLKILDHDGNGSVENMISAIKWIISHYRAYNIRIVNISIGNANDKYASENNILNTWIDKLWNKGIVVCVSAGNNGPAPQTITTPGNNRNVITVGSYDQYAYSGRGPTTSCICKPEIVVAGTNILSCKNAATGYVTKSGTSMSVPIVSGSLALLLEQNPSLTNKDVKKLLKRKAKTLGLPREIQGWGTINVPKLLDL